MEVHHHPEVEKKTFRQYLLEGLMIFLAVMMGYLAETLREQISDNHKGKEYISSFVSDLKIDTAQYSKLISELMIKDSVLNSIYACFDTIKQKGHTPLFMRRIISQSSGFTDFIYSDRTIQQLKNAGGLRLISDKASADSIMVYDSRVRAEMIHQESLEKWQQIVLEADASMVSFKQLGTAHLKTSGNTSRIILQSTDEKELNSYFNRIEMFKISSIGQLKRLKRLKANALRLIIFLQKKRLSNS